MYFVSLGPRELSAIERSCYVTLPWWLNFWISKFCYHGNVTSHFSSLKKSVCILVLGSEKCDCSKSTIYFLAEVEGQIEAQAWGINM